jgi:hypothetical protein
LLGDERASQVSNRGAVPKLATRLKECVAHAVAEQSRLREVTTPRFVFPRSGSTERTRPERGVPVGVLSRLTGFVRWVLAPESLDTDGASQREPEGNAEAHRSRTFLRTLLTRETLPLDPPAEEANRGPLAALRWLLRPDTLPRDEPEVAEASATPRRGMVSWLLARERLPVDEVPPETAPRPPVITLRWLLAREALPVDETPTPPPNPHRVGLRWLFTREPLEAELPTDEQDSSSSPPLS